MRKWPIFLAILLVLFAATIILKATSIVSSVKSNLGWVRLNEQLAAKEVDVRELDFAVDMFTEAVEANPMNSSASFGLGMAHALQGSADKACDIWRISAADTELLMKYGLISQENEDLDVALTHFRAVGAGQSPSSSTGLFLSESICHETRSKQNLLREANQKFCAEYFQNRGGNLIFNNDFSNGSLNGWNGQPYFMEPNPAEMNVESTSQATDFVVRLEGIDESNHLGLYQTLELNPGAKLRFSGRFRTSNVDNLKVRILYISWLDEDGVVQGNAGFELSETEDWMEYERTFALPENSKSNVDFYPLVFSGEGSVWFDDIRLTLIQE